MGHHGRNMSRELKEQLFLSERRLEVAEMYLVKGKKQSEIAAELGVSQSTISNDVRAILYEYSMKRMNKLQSYLNIELAKLNSIEKQAWLAWERSIGKSKRVTEKRDVNGDLIEKVVQTDELVGDPRFLTQVQAAIDRRIRLLGLDAPQEVLVNTMEGRLTRLITEGRVTFDMLARDVGKDMARRYFNMAGVEIPSIVEGEVIEQIELSDEKNGRTRISGNPW